jgi:hypothetical protein
MAVASPVLQSVRPLTLARERVLPVPDSLASLLPEGGLRRGCTVVVSGSSSLALALVSAASASGSWCAAVGLPALGMGAAAAAGADLSRFALVPDPGSQWPDVTAALLDALDVVLVRGSLASNQTPARRLVSRARERGSVLVALGSWPQRDLSLRAESSQWEGLGQGHGHLCRRTMTVVSAGRGAASRERRTTLTLP